MAQGPRGSGCVPILLHPEVEVMAKRNKPATKAELKKLKPGDEKFQAKFSVLSELVKHHIEEEEGEMFPKAEECDIDWESLEASVMKRKETLLAKASGRKTGTRPSRKTIR